MANSQYAYVRLSERPDPCNQQTWITIRLDGRGFTKLTQKYAFAKPNDLRALELMNAAATEVVRQLTDIVVAYGQSDEFSFVFARDTTLFERRAMKLVTTVVSTFTAEYCLQWPKFFPGLELERPYPSFDGRAVEYPNVRMVRDYLAWRQVDCHINNLYNTTFWALVLRGGMSGTAAEERLKGTVSADKNELLYSEFGVNYNNEPEVFRKGTVIYRAFDDEGGGANGVGGGENGKAPDPGSKTQMEKEKKRKRKARIAVEHVDVIGNGFWEARPWILGMGGKGTG